MTPHQKALCDLFEPPSSDPAWRWIEEHVELGSNSELKRFDFDLVPMHRWVHEQLQRSDVRQFTMMVCAQAGKTVNMLAHLLYKIRNQPRDVAWYTDTTIKAVADYKTKIRPFFENARGIGALFPKDRNKKSQKLIQFDSMNMHILGAESASNRESITLFEAYCDEVRNYKPGALTQIDNRMKTIRASRRVVFSSAGNEHDELHRAFNEGTRTMFHFRCPHCQHKQPFRFGQDATTLFPEPREAGGFVWESNEVTHPSEDQYNFTELAKTVRYECENVKCKHKFTKADKWQLLATLEPVNTNPHADPANVSVHFWEAYMPWQSCDWDSIVIKFLRAQLAAKRGDFEPLRVFVCETLGEPWRPPGGHTVQEGEIMRRCGDYMLNEKWEDSIGIITCDFQLGYLFFVHRAVKKNSGSRLINCGTLPTFDDLRQYQIANGVADRCVFIDCAYKPSEVFDACASHGRWIADRARPQAPYKGRAWDGWTPMRGEEYSEYTMPIASGEKIKTHWRLHDQEVKVGRAGVSPIIRVILFSKPWFRERLFLYAVKGEMQWEIPRNIQPDYTKQMGNVVRKEMLDISGQVRGYEWAEKGRHDYPDCYDSQTEVLTADGWKLFADVGDEPVATVNLATDEIEFQKPTSRINRQYDGDMVSIEGRSTSCLVTPNHRMVTVDKRGRNPRIKKASELTIWDFLKPSAKWNAASEDTVRVPACGDIPAVEVNRIVLARFMGWYVAEGHYTMHNKLEGFAHIVVSQNKGAKQDEIAGLLELLPWKFSNSSGRQFVSHSRQLLELVKECGKGAANKRVPQWIKDSSVDVIEAFLDSAVKGDGWRAGKTYYIATTSRRLAGDYAELIAKTGYRASINVRKAKPYCVRGRSGTNTMDQYHVARLTGKRIHLRDSTSRSLISVVQYSGTVHCLTVPNGTLIVRRNGKMMVCGNCEQMLLAVMEIAGL